ncbi:MULTISPECIES: hypothetical protein [Halomonadaceae]|nr:hypothetical protein [Halomonas piezotolerans]MCG7578174.1 hypothetical protein [Halomonas sp. MMH1-48]MCG7614450.1 hypothetical protein [Halomonas sp. MM17-29]
MRFCSERCRREAKQHSTPRRQEHEQHD